MKFSLMPLLLTLSFSVMAQDSNDPRDPSSLEHQLKVLNGMRKSQVKRMQAEDDKNQKESYRLEIEETDRAILKLQKSNSKNDSKDDQEKSQSKFSDDEDLAPLPVIKDYTAIEAGLKEREEILSALSHASNQDEFKNYKTQLDANKASLGSLLEGASEGAKKRYFDKVVNLEKRKLQQVKSKMDKLNLTENLSESFMMDTSKGSTLAEKVNSNDIKDIIRSESTLQGLNIDSCKWETDAPKRVISAPGCDNKGLKICVGYVVCDSKIEGAPSTVRMSTCSVDNCSDAVVCTKEGGYSSGLFNESAESSVKRVMGKNKVKKQ